MVEQNLRSAMRFFGRASGVGTVHESDGMVLIDSGVNYTVFNIAMMNGPVGSAAELDRRIGTAARWYGARNARWSQWVCEDHLPASLRGKAGGIFLRHRMRPLSEAPGMVADRLQPAGEKLPAIQWERVADARTRTEFAHLTTVGFDIPFATSRRIYEPDWAWQADYEGYVGYVRGRPVSTVAIVVAAESIGVYSVMTLPDERRHGYAEALMRTVLREVSARTGIERTVLQATRAAHSMYRRMGYRDVTNFSVYMGQ